MGVFPMVRWKYMDSILCELIMRSSGSISSSLPKRAICAVNCVFVCCESITWRGRKEEQKRARRERTEEALEKFVQREVHTQSVEHLHAPDPADSQSVRDP